VYSIVNPILGENLQITIIRAQSRDREAFAALFEQYKNLVYKTAYLMLGEAAGRKIGAGQIRVLPRKFI